MKKHRPTETGVTLTLTDRVVADLEPEDRAWIAWDDILPGFGIRVDPSGGKSFLIVIRPGHDGPQEPNDCIPLGRHDRMSAVHARRRALGLLARASREGSAAERGVPLLSQAFEAYIVADSNRKQSTNEQYKRVFRRYLADWAPRAVDSFARQDVEARFNSLTLERGRSSANQAIGLMRAVFRRTCGEVEGLGNPVDLWLAGGGRFHRRSSSGGTRRLVRT